MTNGIYTISELQAVLSPIFASHGVKSATLFGSYGKGTATQNSDIDLLVDSGLHGLSFVGFLDEVQRAVGKEVDLLDITHIQPGSLIDQEIRATGVVVYEK